jgi:hypothetical protein
MYKVRSDHGVLATPWGNWNEGEAFTPTPDIPKEKIATWLKTGVLVADEDGPDVEEMLDDTDVLSPLSRKALLKTISLNPDLKASIKVYNSWTPDMIRQAIRDITPDLSVLTMPPPEDSSSL